MMKTGFFLSPLIHNVNDFTFISSGNYGYLDANIVKSIVLTPSFGGSFLWKDTYSLKLMSYHGVSTDSLPLNIFSKTYISIPAGYTEAQVVNCDGSIDVVNGVYPAPKAINTLDLLNIDGWLAVSVKEGIVPDDVFMTLSKDGRIIRYIEASRTPRKDVKKYFKLPKMPDVGYKIIIDVKNLNGNYVLGLARGYKGKLEYCSQFKIPVTIGEVNTNGN